MYIYIYKTKNDYYITHSIMIYGINPLFNKLQVTETPTTEGATSTLKAARCRSFFGAWGSSNDETLVV